MIFLLGSVYAVSKIVVFFFSSRRRHTRCALVLEFRRVLFRSAAPKSFGVRIRLVGEVEKPGLDPFGIDIEEPVQARRDHGNRVMPMIRREREQLVESAPPGDRKSTRLNSSH